MKYLFLIFILPFITQSIKSENTQELIFNLLPYSDEDKSALKSIEVKNEIIIAVMDSGIDCLNPEIKRRIWVPEEFKSTHPCGYNAFNNSSEVRDLDSHGTAVVSLILAMHPSIKIFPIKSISDLATKEEMIKANTRASEIIIKYKHKIKVVNLSMNPDSYNRQEEEMIRAFDKEKINVIVSAGNYGGDTTRDYPSGHSTEFDSVISVGGGYRFSEIPHEDSNFSSSAVLISTSFNQFAITPNRILKELRGTSFSAPIVSSVVALMREVNPDLSLSMIKNILIETAHKSSKYAGKNLAQGELNIQGALERSQFKKSIMIVRYTDKY